ncbi:MAG: SDR family oxidoreductase [Bacteroidota bacterium]
MQDQVVWITGASSGIGEALAIAFAKKGARVILSSRRREALEAVKKNSSNGDRMEVIPLDMTQAKDVQERAQEVIQQFGRVDILVNNAGISQRSLVKDTPLEIDRRVMEVDFFGTVALTKAVLPIMLAQKSGRILVVSSLTGKFGTPLRSAYAAAKHALHGFFDSLRAEVHDDGLQVMLICPGFIKTDVSKNAITADGTKHDKMDDKQASGMDPSDLAERIIRAMQAGKEEAYFGGYETFGVYLKRFFPRLFSRYIRQAKVT